MENNTPRLRYILYLSTNTKVSPGLLAAMERWAEEGKAVCDALPLQEIKRDPETLYLCEDSDTAKKLLKEDMAVLGILKTPEELPFCAEESQAEGLQKPSRQEKAGSSMDGIPYVATDPEELEYTYLLRVWQRYRGIPWKILETDRCVIRETTVEDVEDFYRIYAVPSITKYMEDLFQDPQEEVEYTKTYIEKVYNLYGYGIWTVCLKGDGRVIGRAGVTDREGYEDPELGYMIAAPCQRQGYALEVCRAICTYAREELGFTRLQVLTEPENSASTALCEKLGIHWADPVTEGKILYRRGILDL